MFHVKHATPRFDVVVVGAGHAGVEASAAAARAGAQTALVTQRLDSIGAMSCNPAIGGLGKGHLVREIDALDGIMPRAADLAAIQLRLLNRSKGPAVQGLRAQIDRALYRRAVRRLLDETENLTLIEDECVGLSFEYGGLFGVETTQGVLPAKGVVLTAGTFLNGVIHIGSERTSAGRVGDKAVVRLAEQLRALNLPVGRLKTGTPPRLDGRTIDYASLEPQWGDEQPEFFSALTTSPPAPQTPCYVTRTTPDSHAIVRKDLHLTAVYSGAISGRGPRYCPSIEDKIVKFADRDGHQIFLEPEGLDSPLVYPNGISTSLPREVQHALVRSIPGLERAKIVQPGYAIEYDFFNPTALTPHLMVKPIEGLFFAGQINGTTGYEEAAAQGLAAGLNAALFATERPLYRFERSSSYIGVMLDDLVTRGVTEPYRMFTSRAEYRLLLRSDNADARLTADGIALGLVKAERRAEFERTATALDAARDLLRNRHATGAELARAGLEVQGAPGKRSAWEWLAVSGLSLTELARLWPELLTLDDRIFARVEADARYSVYEARLRKDLERFVADETLDIPTSFDYDAISGLSNEVKAKFKAHAPASLGQAGRIEGVTPASLMLVAAHVRRKRA